MTKANLIRQATRRTTLVGARAAFEITRQATASARAPGLTTLLLHNTPRTQLDRLARWVDRNRDDVVSFADGLDRVRRGDLDRRLFALSFDDGFRSNLDAARMLADRGLRGVFYVPTDVIGMSKSDSDSFFRSAQAEEVVSWDDLETLRSAGHEVGSHCRQHVPMVNLSEGEAEDQLKGSVALLRERLGSTQHFAWPYGGLQHVDVQKVVAWSREINVVPASGVRGRSTQEGLELSGFLLRDAVDLQWINTDLVVFGALELTQGKYR